MRRALGVTEVPGGDDRDRDKTWPMSIPLTQTCPQCEADMELLTTDDEGEIVVYECPDCGFQVEDRVADDESDNDHEPGAPPLDGEDELEMSEPDDAS